MNIPENILTKKDINNIKEQLTVVVENEYSVPKKYKIYEYFDGVYTLPVHWASENIEFKPDPVFKLTKYVNTGRFLTKPREEQQSCLNECHKQFKRGWGGGIINMTTGSGKSVVAMMIFSKLRLKTIVIVHTVELMQQWIKTINHFLPDARVGKIQGQVFDTKDKDIVIGMLQTVSMKADLKKEMFEEFGLAIYDEVQFLSAEVFSRALLKTRARYTFGLSATVERKDGLEKVFKYHIGDIIYSNVKNSLKQNTIINIIRYTNDKARERTIYNGKPNISAMITELSEDIQRTKMICDEIKKLSRDRNILILSERVEHLKCMQKIIGDDESGLFIGKMKESEKTESKKKRILFATYHIASVGFDHPKLNTIVLSTPRSDITQAIGRIYRRIHEIDPMIIDIVDSHSVFPYQYKKRNLIYKKSISKEENECMFE
jgi:superfamily II DNA or RNA helicase